MKYVVTLVSEPQRAALDDMLVRTIASHLPAPEAPVWLAPHIAADIAFASDREIDNRKLADRLRREMGDAPVDIIVQPLEGRRKKLFLADMDSTMIGQECIDELADFVGLKTHVAGITERAMRGEIAFEPALRERVALLKGLAETIVEKVIAERITLTPGGRELVQTMRARGAYTALVSGGFTLFTQKVAAMIGFQENRANRLVIEDGKFVGLVEEPILGREAKLAALTALRVAHELKDNETMAVGDGANDLAMLEAAGMGVAFHAKPAVAAAAEAQINHGDLTALLYMQGYRRDEFVV
jgi:phosphoserine phosphatase